MGAIRHKPIERHVRENGSDRVERELLGQQNHHLQKEKCEVTFRKSSVPLQILKLTRGKCKSRKNTCKNIFGKWFSKSAYFQNHEPPPSRRKNK